ncbi:MAG: alpha/beta fold hydrolase [Parvibaculales bacterium]
MKILRPLSFAIYFMVIGLVDYVSAEESLMAVMEQLPKPEWSKGASDLMPQGSLFLAQQNDGIKTRVAVFEPSQKLQATLVLMTGYSEFIEKYHDIIPVFQAQGFRVVIPEWRGHGLSDGRLKLNPAQLHVTDFDLFVSDLIAIMGFIRTQYDTHPIFGLAHSMGGQIALRAVHEKPDLFVALALSAPMIDIPNSTFEKQLLKILGSAYVFLGQGEAGMPFQENERENGARGKNFVTTNEARFQVNEDLIAANPAINVGGRSIEFVLRAVQVMAETQKPDYLARIKTPIFAGVAPRDTLVLSDATIAMTQLLPQASYKIYPESMHEILMEQSTIRDAFIADVMAHFAAAQNQLTD